MPIYTVSEKMNLINGDSPRAYSFQEALNKHLKDNISGYSAIGLNDYTPQEALALIEGKTNIHDLTVEELLNEMVSGNTGLHTYTAQEAMNRLSSSDFGS